MNHIESEIAQYESQLAQVQLAISASSEGPEKNSLCALEADLKELITLSKSNFKEENHLKEDPLYDEYNLFKAELANLNVETNEYEGKTSECKTESSNATTSNALIQEISNLKGTKCQAPFMYKWTNEVTYHNAFVSHVPEVNQVSGCNDVEVKVMFMNPTHKEMLPCPYYLEGHCKFSDDKCRYSHGELVLLSSLKDYREPVFSELSIGSQIFAKQDDGLWYRAFVLNINDSVCQVKFQSNSKEEFIPLHNILPLGTNEKENCTNSDSDSDSNSDSDVNDSDSRYDENTVKRILSNTPGSALGEWEKFTKGFGSKIMAKMGYIHGAGLGKDGLGRVEPVPAVVLPAGKSLDHCMMLKQKSGNDNDLFKAERKMKRLQKKHEEKMKKAYENEKEKTDVFTFINTKLDFARNEDSPEIKVKKPLKNETTRNLNVTCLQLSEEMKKLEKEIKCLNQSLLRHSPHSQTFNIIKGKLASKENKLSELYASERKVRNEQDQRRDRQKLTVF